MKLANGPLTDQLNLTNNRPIKHQSIQQQFFSELPSGGLSHYMNYRYSHLCSKNVHVLIAMQYFNMNKFV